MLRYRFSILVTRLCLSKSRSLLCSTGCETAEPFFFVTRQSLVTRKLSANTASGYTLLEILMVVALIGLMAGLAVPRLTSIYDGVQWAGERDEVLRRISGLGFAAFQEGREFALKKYPADDSDKLPLELPVGWTLEAEKPIQYRSNGVCLGGKLRLSYGERAFVLHLRPPHGKPE